MSARDFANTFKASFAIIIFWIGSWGRLVRFDNENTHVQIIRLQSPQFTSENVFVCVCMRHQFRKFMCTLSISLGFSDFF